MDSFYRKEFWDKIKGDEIESQEAANILYNFAVNSGVSRTVKAYKRYTRISKNGFAVRKLKSKAKNFNKLIISASVLYWIIYLHVVYCV